MTQKSIFSSAVLLSGFVFFTKGLGLLKQVAMAAIGGASAQTDSFFVACGVVGQLCLILFSALSVSLLPIYTKMLVQKGREAANELINAVLRVCLPLALLLVIICYISAPVVARFFSPIGAEADYVFSLTYYLRLISVAFLLWGYFLTVNVILETEKIFIPGRSQGFFQNLFLIIALVFFFRAKGVGSLVYAFLLSGLVECILVTYCARKHFSIIWGKITSYKTIWILLRLAFPLMLGNAMFEINDIVDKKLATMLGTGNVSFLTYGGSINEIITTLIISSVSTVLFAHFSTLAVENQREKIGEILSKALASLSLAVLPFMIICLTIGRELVYCLYGRGAFGIFAVEQTVAVVMGYAVGFIFNMAHSNLVRVFYAFQNTAFPMVIGIITVLCNIGLSIILSRFLGIGGIALATSLSLGIATLLLVAKVKIYLPGFSLLKDKAEYIKGIIAALVAAGGSYVLQLFNIGNSYIKFLIISAEIVCIYLVVLYVLRSQILADFLGRISLLKILKYFH